MAEQTDNENAHFNKLFWFCVWMAGTGLLFLMALCYLPIPKASERFADNVQGFIEGSVVTAAFSFLLGGTLPVKKVSSPTVLQTGDSPTNTVNPEGGVVNGEVVG